MKEMININDQGINFSDYTYVRKLITSERESLSIAELNDILECEHAQKLADRMVKELEIVQIKEKMTKYEGEHTNSLALIIEIESQKYELEELKKNLEALTVKLERLSVVDGLTNIANRRHFDNFFNTAWRSALRDRQTLALIFIDVDYFKAYNDYYGHQKGDDCLKTIANVLNKFGQRSKDLVARYGGEEFVIILSDTDYEKLSRMAERIRRSIEQLGIPHEWSGASAYVTVSLGVVICSPDSEKSPKNLLRLADEGLYEAKNSGRNTIKVKQLEDEI